MITRDITLTDAILDLIDNSIDTFIKKYKFDATKFFYDWDRQGIEKPDFHIKLSFNGKKFCIEDNWLWVSIDDAKSKVFRFWTAWASENTYHWLSVYWIGMKRAFFKIWNYIEFKSQTSKEKISVHLDVDDRMKEEKNWDIPITEEWQTDNSNAWTFIQITKLHKTISDDFTLPTFIASLISKIQSTYHIFIDLWIKIYVNWSLIEKEDLKIEYNEKNNKPIKKSIDSGWVKVYMIAWSSPKEDMRAHWWYIFCNWRMILKANQWPETGRWDKWWSSTTQRLRAFHSSINHFLWLVYFSSNNLELLPWKTTKDWLDLSSPVYKEILWQMRIVAKEISSKLAAVYGNNAKKKQKKKREETTVKDIEENKSFIFETSNLPDDTEIRYTKPEREVEKVINKLSDIYGWDFSPDQAWEKTFEYFIDKEC